MASIYTSGFEDVPVRLTIYLTRREVEEAEQVARILGLGTVERLIQELISEKIREMKKAGYVIKPFWERDRI